MPWLAVKLEVDPAAAEALSEALLQAGAEAVFVDEVHPSRLEALLRGSADAQALLRAAARLAGTARPTHFSVAPIDEHDWVRESQSQFAPLAVGERLWVGASWHQAPAHAGVVVRIDPGLAFGTGAHPSTRLALGFLESRVHGGERVLDYGCGSGILAIAAAKLGAAQSDAVDVDPLALEVTAANARANAVAVRALAPEDLAGERYDVVVSNILAKPLIVLAPLLARLTQSGGWLALSGILESQAAEVAAAYEPAFGCEPPQVEDGWALIAARRL